MFKYVNLLLSQNEVMFVYLIKMLQNCPTPNCRFGMILVFILLQCMRKDRIPFNLFAAELFQIFNPLHAQKFQLFSLQAGSPLWKADSFLECINSNKSEPGFIINES